MSFTFNESSSEDEDFVNSFAASASAPVNGLGSSTLKPSVVDTSTSIEAATGANAADSPFLSDDDESLQDVDWEDAESVGEETGNEIEKEEEEEAIIDPKPAGPVPITIDLNSKPPAKKTPAKKKRKISRKAYGFNRLPDGLKKVLLNIHRSHMLTLTSRVVHLSRCCSDVELLHLASSICPEEYVSANNEIPTESQLRAFCLWYFDLVNNAEQRLQRRLEYNRRAGAPTARRNRGSNKWQKKMPSRQTNIQGEGRTNPFHFTRLCCYLPTTLDENPQLFENDDDRPSMTQNDKAQLLVAMARSIGWRARLVVDLDPISCNLHPDHPFFVSGFKNVFQSILQNGSCVHDAAKKMPAKENGRNGNVARRQSDSPREEISSDVLMWVEILCQRNMDSASKQTANRKSGYRWMHVDPGQELINQPKTVESILGNLRSVQTTQRRNQTISYALAVEHCVTDFEESKYSVRVTDVTARYAAAWSKTLAQRGFASPGLQKKKCVHQPWWEETLKQINSAFSSAKPKSVAAKAHSSDAPFHSSDHHDEAESLEKAELLESVTNEALPTSKKAFKNHPIYAIASLLNSTQVLAPDAKKRVCGIFKGELVYRRNDVSTALTAKQWLYQNRQVKSVEIEKPIKRVKARKKPSTSAGGFRALKSYGVGSTNDGSARARERDIEQASIPIDDQPEMDKLYAIWQTRQWSPPFVGPDDMIPVNEYNNVDVALLNPGLIHLREQRISVVAKRLGIPYAPALLGFEGQGGNRVPTIRGIVVHEHNAELLRAAHAEYQSEAIETEIDKRQELIYKRWKKLIVGIQTKVRLEREYGSKES